MISEPRTTESFTQQAEDILTHKFCRPDLPLAYRNGVLARLLLDIYFDGYDEGVKLNALGGK